MADTQVPVTQTEAAATTTGEPARWARGGLGWRLLLRWEAVLVVLLIASILYGRSVSTHFLSGSNLFFTGLNVGEIAIMALPLTFIVITGEIDLSVASMLGLASTLLGVLYKHGWSIWAAMAAVLVVGALGGALNGVLITRLGLPSIAVTIGTLTLFRGIAEIILKSDSVTGFPIGWTNIGILPIHGTHIAYSVGVFLLLAVVFGIVLHGTPLGRSIYAIGLQAEAAFFAGIRVQRIKFWLYVLSGVICALAGILWTFRFATARYNAGTGLELNVVALVLLGGVSIFGGRGSILGVVLAACVLGSLQEAMTLVNVAPQVQNIVVGALLLVSVAVPNAPELIARVRRRLASSRLPRRGTTEGVSVDINP
ncbi:MAG TPA: ABC transporter permease [Mycobacteriales bacterium]|nr:ABC transporter permease [Mycobacteriales bacterium]